MEFTRDELQAVMLAIRARIEHLQTLNQDDAFIVEAMLVARSALEKTKSAWLVAP
jgi:hypothetical protein